MDHQVTSNTLPSSSPINPQWKVDLPSNTAAQNHGKFVPMQFRTQPVNIPGGMHRQATNLQLYDRGKPFVVKFLKFLRKRFDDTVKLLLKGYFNLTAKFL